MAVVPKWSLELDGNAAYRYGGRLFLMSGDREDQRRKTDEHKRVCKHIRVSDHIAHPLFREVDNLPFLPTHLSYHAARALSISVGDLPLRVEACRFLSENKSAGAIDKPAR